MGREREIKEIKSESYFDRRGGGWREGGRER